ncbi:Hint domain-containing protein [Gymnodinialimonas hymeniacidonis]|uniref:Hint domain-containing protein n=1 Tax=Gymnodinialimonas hymeniacidonis TaxID=3126508 RepID=UPI0034C67B2E
MATIDGSGNDDTLSGTEGDDTINGSSGEDSCSGGGRNDSVDRGDDGDQISGDAGDDGSTVHGYNDDGTLTDGKSEDAFVIRDGHGNDVITDFDPDKEIIAFEMTEIASFSDVSARLTEQNGNSIITFDNGDLITLYGVTNADLSPSNFAYSAGPVCLMEGTMIQTERGEVAIEYLRPDDIIWTKDKGWQAIRLVTFERMVFTHRDDPAKPILIPSGALGSGMPKVDLITSPQHRILQILPRTGEEILVPAVKLIGENGIRRMRGKRRVHYLNIVLERHSIIQASGCWVESMLITSRSLERQTKAARRLLAHCKDMRAARRIEQKGARVRRLRSA